MRIMKCKWINRGIAGLLMVSMLVSTAPVTYAQEIQGNNEIVTLTENVPDTESDNANDASTNIAGTVTGDSAASEVDTAPTAGTSDNTVTGDSAASEVDTAPTAGTSDNTVTGNSAASEVDTASNAGTSDNTVTGDSAAPKVDTTPNTGASDNTVVEDNAASEANSAADTDVDIDTVTGDVADTEMDDAANTDADADIDVVAVGVSETDDTITVSDAAGLIELSNRKASTYDNKTIKIAMTGSQTIYALTQSVTINETEMSFKGLGSTDYPFQGTILFPEGSNKPIKTKVPLFNSVSSAAVLPEITFQVDEDVNTSGSVEEFTNQPLLANTVIGTGNATWNVTLQKGETSNGNQYTIGGVIGTLKSGSVTLNVTNSVPATLRVTGDSNRGLFCNTMESGANLTANLTKVAENGQISVSTASGDAGGFVGCMKGNNTLTVSGSGVSNVTSSSDNAGGVVGSCTANTTSTGTLDLSNITLNTTLSGGQNAGAGGVFGALHNNGGTLVITGNPSKAIGSSGAAQNYGGLIGQTDGTLTATLIIQNLSVSSSVGSNTKNYGGVIGKVGNNSYVRIENQDTTQGIVTTAGDPVVNFGGLVGGVGDSNSAFLNIGSVKLTRENNPSATNSIGGLVGSLASGVVRLHGTTDLSYMYFDLLGGGTGQIVGRNTNGLVYAVGNGNNTEGDSDWMLKRPNSQKNPNIPSSPASDIGNWGQVIRLDGNKLKETTSADDTDAPNLFYFEENAHTVTVLGSPASTYSINSVRDFAAYALTYDFGGVDQETLKFSGGNATTVQSNNDQNITINNTIDLTGTGILGIGRDDGKGSNGNGSADNTHFQGTISGGTSKHKITLDIGNSAFGYGVTDDTDPIGWGGLQMFSDGHNFLGMVSVAGSTTTIKNLTIDGNIIGKSGDEGNIQKRIASVIGYCKSNLITFGNVTVSTNVSVSGKKSWIFQGGFFGDMVNGNQTIIFNGCTWSGSLTNTVSNANDRYSRIGGFAAYIKKNEKLITVEDCTLSGTINTSSTPDAHIGGLFADFESGENTKLIISNLLVSSEGVEATSASSTCGGLLGYSWPKVNVTFGRDDSTDENGSPIPATNGVTIIGSTLKANNARFGGLVYEATGYWDATRANSIVFRKDSEQKANSFSGKSDDGKNNTSGLLVGNGWITAGNTTNALYLEVGTWGLNGAYYIAQDSVELPENIEYFDELVGVTKVSDDGNNNAVVSLAVRDNNGMPVSIDTNTGNTYTGQIKNYKNPNTRYYYNLDSFRKLGVEYAPVNSPETLVLWSVSQYAANNIRNKFRTSTDSVNIKNNIDLTGYSYYPVTPLSSVTVGDNTEASPTTITFGFEEMNPKENGNKQFTESYYQHYLMQCGLLYNAKDVTVQNTTLSGSVGKTSPTTGNRFDSGALIYGRVFGDVNNNTIYTVKLDNVTLAGLRVTGVNTSTEYAPLLINNIGSGVILTVDGLSTGAGYVNSDNATLDAATSLIGTVGSATASDITLSFSNIALDSRITADTSNTTSVKNNGNEECTVEYNTTHTIFTKATLLDSFRYSAKCSGTYNFNSNDTKVTYGEEISNTDSGRNQGKQYHYYDEVTTTVWDGVKGTSNPTEDEIKTYYIGYRRYVNRIEDEGYMELDINIHPANLLKGCGTYGDPYLIEDGAQLVQLATYINGGDTGNSPGWVVYLNSDVMQNKQNSTNYHTASDVKDENVSVSDNLYYCDGAGWYFATTIADDKFEKNEALGQKFGIANVRAYLRNAYYQIENDIDISSGTGIGSNDTSKAFSGVIVGKRQENGTYPSVNIKSEIGEDNAITQFGGLICFSQGSVVKNLNVHYTSDAKIKITNTGVASTTNNPFFGGVVGYCMGGDTIIDNVSVYYARESVVLFGDNGYDRMIAAGGYVGLVGGAKDTVNNNGYEKTGGGVVFRSIDDTMNTFNNALAYAQQEAPIVNSDGTTQGEGCTYFYCNSYVGRVLDGYACYETQERDSSGHTLNNTDKNYTIPDIVPNENEKLSVTYENSTYTVSVNSAQELWLLSAIVNSGAAAMDAKGIYQDYDNKYVEAYKYGKPRTVSYDSIGENVENKEVVLADEIYWGGDGTDNANRLSYFVKKYTNGTDTAHLTGRSNTGDSKSSNNPVKLVFTDNIDMTTYGNGFRGIGASYGYKTKDTTDNSKRLIRRSLLISSVTGNNTIIQLAMKQRDYQQEYINNNTQWTNQGAGLFTVLTYKAEANKPCEVKNLTLKGTVGVLTYNIKNGQEQGIEKKNYDVGVGSFASRTIRSSNELKFNYFHLDNMLVIGGTSTGGVIGLNEDSGKLSFENWSIYNATVYKWVNNDGSTGGLVGWHHSKKELYIKGYGSKEDGSRELNVQNLNVTVKADKRQYGNVGGLTGANDDSTVQILDVNIQNLKVKGTNAREIGGLADGGNSLIIIKNCWIKDITVTGESSSGPVGGLIGYGYTTIENVTIKGDSINPVKISNNDSAGGFIGNTKNAATIKDCKTEYVHILSGVDASGLIGKTENTTKASNISFTDVIVATKNNSNNYTGLLLGNNNSKTLYGYNILAKNCKLGYVTDSTVTVDNLKNVADDNWNTTNSGLWVGNATGTVELVAVGVDGTNVPQKDYVSGSASITYADYPAVQTNTTGSSEPWLDVNPVSELTVNGETTPLTLTGNGVGYIVNSTETTNENGTETLTIKGDSVAKKILDEVTSDEPKKYVNLDDGSRNRFSKLLLPSNPVYLTSYHEAEEAEKTKVPSTVDFPIVVVNSNDNNVVSEHLWNFIAAMTNTANGEQAKTNVSNVSATTYQWTGEGEAAEFRAQDKDSLTIDSSKNILTNGRFDNEQSQFTLLDVQYADPTGSNANGFHLYIPVLVVKVLTVKVNVDILEGTNYYSGDYVQLRNYPHYATAGFGETITAFIEYNYERSKDEWQRSLDNGENLLWYYQKTIGLLNANQSGSKNLPTGTKMLLLDKQNSNLYEYTMTDDVDQNCFDFGNFTLVGDSKQYFTPTPICDLLNISAMEKTDNTGKYVTCDKESATVRDKKGNYYRPKTEDDTDETTYILSVGADVLATDNDYLEQGDAYYLTMEVPKTEGVTVINNLMGPAAGSLERSDMAPPNNVLPEDKGNGTRMYNDRYFFYYFLNQGELSVESKRLSNGKEQSTTEMKQGDAIQITLSTPLSLTSEGRENYAYKPRSMYQQFSIDLKKYDDANSINGAAAPIGADSASWTYQVLDGDNPLFTASGAQFGLQNLSSLTIGYGGTENGTGSENLYLPKLLYEKASGIANAQLANNPLTVKLVVTLEYPNVNGFPVRANTNLESTDGLSVHGVSRVANQESQLPITTIKNDKDEENKRYYTSELSYVTLNYNAVQKGIGESIHRDDTNTQLGINPSDELGNILPVFTLGYYDYSQVAAADMTSAKKIRYTVELFQKDNDGNYTDDSLVPISGGNGCWEDGYLVQVDNMDVALEKDTNTNRYFCTPDIPADENGNQYSGSSIRIDFTPVMGAKFEERDFTYANYKIRLTAVLLDAEGNEITGTKASDYIIYTNARIYQGMIETPTSITSGQ